MKIFRHFLLISSLIFVCFGSSMALDSDLLPAGLSEKISPDSLPALPSGITEPKSGALSGMQPAETESGIGQQNPKDITEFRKSFESVIPDTTYKTEADELQKKPYITVKAEPGDGLVTLNWSTINLQYKPEEQPVKFAILYGVDSGQLLNKIEVGQLTSYTLRGLRNNQTYFFQIFGYSKDKKNLLASEEDKIVPLAVEDQRSPLENSYAKEIVTLQDKITKEPFKRNLKQFGYDFFRNSKANFSIDNLPVGSDYIIGPGDSLRLDLWGGVQARLQLTVDRNGEANIPKVGNVKLWGLNYTQARETINKAISRYYKGYELNVTLGSLRSIQVYVIGEVAVPGTYTVSSLATVLNALSAAGGPSKNGSLRSIKFLKNGDKARQIDLYDMFLSGDRSKDVRLENGDTIFVPVLGPVVAVAGEVKRPAIYELKGNTSVADVLSMAGGITAAGDASRIQIERIVGNDKRVVLDHEMKGKGPEEELKTIQVSDRDMVKVFSVQESSRQVVSLRGSVFQPGEYQFRAGMRITDIITSFAVLLPDSYPAAAQVIRLVPPDLHREVLSFNLTRALAGDPSENISLQEQDTIKVFSRWEMQEKPGVSINGHVVNPGAFMFYPRMTVRDLVTAAGSLKRNAFLENAELTRIDLKDGKARATRIHVNLEKALKGDPENNLQLQPDDVLIVRGIEDWLEASDRFVTLDGEVRFPGVYSISKGERLTSVIARAGGYSDKAYLMGAKFTRKSVQETQQKRMDEVIARTEKDVLEKQSELASLSASKEELDATKAALDSMMKGLQQLKGKKAEGRVVIRLSPLDELAKSPYDLELMGGDRLVIPQTPSVIHVMGLVYNPTTLVYMPGRDVSYYLKKSGGPTRDAETDEMYLIKSDGSVVSKQQSSFGIKWDDDSNSWTFGSFMSTRLDPGDTLVVPQKLERIAWMREIKDITTILSQIAMTAGVMLAAGAL